MQVSRIAPSGTESSGDLVLLEDQDRKRWDHAQIQEGLSLATAARNGAPTPFALQAAIAAVHCRAASPANTDWSEILRLYDLLETIQPSPVVSLNRAVAVAMTEGPSSALAIFEGLEKLGQLESYHLLHAAKADLLRRCGLTEDATVSYRRAIDLATNDRERSWLEQRLRQFT